MGYRREYSGIESLFCDILRIRIKYILKYIVSIYRCIRIVGTGVLVCCRCVLGGRVVLRSSLFAFFFSTELVDVFGFCVLTFVFFFVSAVVKGLFVNKCFYFFFFREVLGFFVFLVVG